MKVRAANEQSIPDELIQRIGDLTARLVALSEYIRRVTSAYEGARTNDAADFGRPIEFLTANGFAIVRRWEANCSPAPTNTSFCFLVRGEEDTEYQVIVEIAKQIINETEFNTRGHIQVSSSVWIYCAERHLADYLEEHDHVPDNNKLTLEILNCEAVMLAIRWERSDV